MKVHYNEKKGLVIRADDEQDAFKLGVLYGKARADKMDVVANCDLQESDLPKVTIKLCKYVKLEEQNEFGQ